MRSGRLTLPTELRRALNLSPNEKFEVDIEDGAIVLHPIRAGSESDAWAYTPEYQRLMQQAYEDVEAGRLVRMSRDDLSLLAADDQ